MNSNRFYGYRAIIYIVIAFIIFTVDQVAKWLVVTRGGFDIIKDFWNIGFYKNFGSAFGIPIPYFLLYPLIFIAIILIIWRYYPKLRDRDLRVWIACLLVFSGALSNLVDRFARGYVVDYIHFSFGSTFNIADVVIVVGILILLWNELKSPITKSQETNKIQ